MSKMNKIKNKNPINQQTYPQNPITLNPKDKISFYLTKIQDKIIKQIDQQKNSIPEHNSPFFQTFSQKNIKIKQQQLKKLNDQKSKTQHKLKLLSEKQFQLQHEYRKNLKKRFLKNNQNIIDKTFQVSKTVQMKKSRHQDPNLDNQFLQIQVPNTQFFQNNKSLSLNKLRPKSQLTDEDIKTLKHLKKQYKKFQQQLVNKTKKHNSELQNIKSQNTQLQALIKIQKSDKKKKQIKIRLEQLQKQKLQRIQKFQQDQIRLLELKKRPKIHQKISKQFQQKERALQEGKIQEMKQRLKKKILNVSEIKQHEQHYQFVRNQKMKSLHEKYLQQSRILKQSKIERQNVSKFYRSVIEEQQEKKNQKRRKQLATIQKCQRIKEYAAKVQQQHYPRLKTKQNDQQQESKSEQNVDRSLSIEERKQLGNNYLRSAIKSLKERQKVRSQLTTSESTQKQSQLPKISSLSAKYKDYLQESRSRYSSNLERSQANQQKLKQKYIQSVQQVKRIIEQDINSKNKQKTIQKIQKVAERMEHEPNDRNYIDKVRAKIKILQTIT